MAVAPHERHGEEIEEAAHVPLDAVVRAAVLARAMIDRELRDPVAAVVREHGDVAVELAVELHPLHDLGPVRLEAAVHVVQPDPRRPCPRRVLKIFDGMRRVSGSRRFVFQPETRSYPSSSLARSRGISAGSSCRSPSIVTTIVSGGLAEARVERGGLAEVPAQPDDADVVVCVVQAGQRAERAVGRAVVDEDRLPRASVAGEGGRELVVEERDAALLVVDRDDDRDHDARVPRAAGVACRS